MRRERLALVLFIHGCTVGAPAADGGPADRDGSCAAPVVSSELGPYPDRVRCPPPPRSRERVVHPETHAALDELEALEALHCEQARAEASHLEPDLWEQVHGETDGRIDVFADAFGFTSLRQLPAEPLDGCTPAERAQEWLDRHRALFALGDSTLERTGDDGREVTFDQRWRGLLVYGASLVLAPGERLRSRLVPAWAMPSTARPAASADDARAVLRASGREVRGDATLAVWVTPSRERTHLAWLLDGCAVDALDATIHACGDPQR